jgi:transposase
MLEIDQEQVIYIDESGIKIGADRQYGYSEVNTRVYSDNTETSEHITLVAGLTEKGVVAPMTLNGYVDENAFICYVQYFLLPVITAGYTIIMDNLSSHNSKEIIKLIEGKSAKVVYLPPYSPELSPIELAWSKIKSIIRDNCPLSRDSLEDAFANAISRISSSDSFAYFSHCSKCLALI